MVTVWATLGPQRWRSRMDDHSLGHHAPRDATGNVKGQMHGFHLWANLPAGLKMTAPRYHDVQGKDIPLVSDDDGTEVKIIVGTFWGQQGGVDGIGTDPQYLDIFMPTGIKRTFKIDTYRWAFAYVF